MTSVSAAVLAAGRYRLDHRVAGGRSGELWRATDLELSRPVAVKLLAASAGRDTAAVARFRAAACCAASLVHEGIVRVFDYGEPDSPEAPGPSFVVMEFVDGPSLADLLAGGPLGAARAMDVIAQTARALDFAHRAGRAHGDLGPQNILLGPDGAVKVGGFGAAGVPGGTAGDLLALGIVAQACLTGSSAPGDAGGPSLPGQVPAPAAEFISQLTGREPAGLPVSAAEAGRRAGRLRDQLAPVSAASGDTAAVTPAGRPGRPAAARTAPATRPGAPGRPRRPAAAARQRGLAPVVRGCAVIAAALAAAAIAGVVMPSGSAPPAGGAAEITSIRVTAAGLVGQPVQVARLRLERLGLVVRVRWQPSARIGAGEVLSVRPAGLVPAHGLITLTGSVRPSGPATPGAAQAGRACSGGRPAPGE